MNLSCVFWFFFFFFLSIILFFVFCFLFFCFFVEIYPPDKKPSSMQSGKPAAPSCDQEIMDEIYGKICPSSGFQLYPFQKMVVSWATSLELFVYRRHNAVGRYLLAGPAGTPAAPPPMLPFMDGGLALVAMGLGKTLLILLLASLSPPCSESLTLPESPVYDRYRICTKESAGGGPRQAANLHEAPRPVVRKKKGRSLVVCQSSVLENFVWHWRKVFCDNYNNGSDGSGRGADLIVLHESRRSPEGKPIPRCCSRCGRGPRLSGRSRGSPGSCSGGAFVQGGSNTMYITSYSTLSRCYSRHINPEGREGGDGEGGGGGGYAIQLFGQGFDRLFLDESQNVRSCRTLLWRSIQALSRKVTFCFSGTAFKSSYSDIIPQLRICKIGEPNLALAHRHLCGLTPAGSSLLADRANPLSRGFWRDYAVRVGTKDVVQGGRYAAPANLDQLRIPELAEVTRYVTLSSGHREEYDKLLAACRSAMGPSGPSGPAGQGEGEGEGREEEEDLFGQGAPSLDSGGPTMTGADTVRAFQQMQVACTAEGSHGDPSTKIVEAVRIVRQLAASNRLGRGAVVFSGFPRVTRNVFASLKEATGSPPTYTPYAIDGAVPLKRRGRIFDKLHWQTDAAGRDVASPAAALPCILCSTFKTSGVGINLTKLSHIILLDTPWDSATKQQAIGRVIRIGNRSPRVHVWSIVARDTVDEFLLNTNQTNLAGTQQGRGLISLCSIVDKQTTPKKKK